MDKKKRLLILIFVLILSGIVVIFIHKNGSMKGNSMFSYYSKQERKYRGFHSYFYCGIGFILGILIHALFTWRFGMMHYIFFFVAVFEVIYALVQMYRYRSYAPFEGGKTTGKKKICGFDKFTIIFCMLVAIIMIYKMPFY